MATRLIVTDFEDPPRNPANPYITTPLEIPPHGVLGVEGWWNEREAGVGYDGSTVARLEDAGYHPGAPAQSSEYIFDTNAYSYATGGGIQFRPIQEFWIEEGPLPPGEQFTPMLNPGMIVELTWRLVAPDRGATLYVEPYQWWSDEPTSIYLSVSAWDDSTGYSFNQEWDDRDIGLDIYQWLEVKWEPNGDWVFGPIGGPAWYSGNLPVQPEISASTLSGVGFDVYSRPEGRRESPGGYIDNVYAWFEGLTVGHTPPPPLRVFPRDDGLRGAAPRVAWGSRSNQSSTRRVGGYL